MLNNVVLVGRLAHDPSLRNVGQDETPVTKFALAVERPYKQEEKEVDFIDIVTWRKLAENCKTYLEKGSMCAVTGRLQIRSYEDKEGVKRKAVEVVANDVRFLSTKKQGQSEAPVVDEIDEEDVPFN